MKAIRLEKLRELRRLKAEKQSRREAESRVKREANRKRWSSPLDMAVELEPPRLDDAGDRQGTWRTPTLDLINAALVDLAEGRESRLAAMVAPQEGKSTLVSFWFPLWLLTCVNADLRILIISYSEDLARGWGAQIKDALERWDGDEDTVDLGLRLRKDSRAAGRWHIEGHRGSLNACGVSGSITGKPANVICVDDPIKSMVEAQSDRVREKVHSAYTSVLVPRLAPGAKMTWIQTLWHEQEPLLQILANEGEKAKGGNWRVIRVPALAEDNDPLGRKPGEGMVSARGARDWHKIRKTVGEFVFSALYQQRPSPAQGNLFKRLHWRYWTTAGPDRIDLGGRISDLRDGWRYGTVDLAASTRTSADYTVIAAWCRTLAGDLVLLDMVRAKIGEGEHFAHARPLIERWQLDTLFVEASQYGFTLVKEATQLGVPVTPIQAEQDKLTRALPYSAWQSGGRAWLPARAEWLSTWVDEHAAFPNGSHDDTIDVGSLSCRVAITQWVPLVNRAQQATVQRTDPEPDPFGWQPVEDFENRAF